MRVILLFSAIFFIVGCGQRIECPQPEKIYVEKPSPKITILNPIPEEETTFKKLKIPFKPTIDPNKIVVDKELLKQSSILSQKKDIAIEKQKRYIRFYEAQNIELRKYCSTVKKQNQQ
jgi:hypothetical protein